MDKASAGDEDARGRVTGGGEGGEAEEEGRDGRPSHLEVLSLPWSDPSALVP